MNERNTIEDFGKGDEVNVEAHPDDIFHDFSGMVKAVNREYIVVVDQDGDAWDCEPRQLSHNSDENVHD